jgi:hypothetical protein
VIKGIFKQNTRIQQNASATSIPSMPIYSTSLGAAYPFAFLGTMIAVILPSISSSLPATPYCPIWP